MPDDQPSQGPWARLWGERSPVKCWVLLLLAGVCVRGFFDVGILHGNHRVAYGWGFYNMPAGELMQLAWYLLFGLGAVGFATAALLATEMPERLERGARFLFAKKWWFVGGAALAVLLGALAVRFWVMLDAFIADDESTYVFIAQTLLQGGVLNTTPAEPEFFRNQFVVLNSTGWFGKYPIGHPLLLAAGEALGLRYLVTPLLTAATLVVTFLVGRRVFTDLEAALGTALLALSPHFVMTGATQLSQPTSTLTTMLGVWAMLALRDQPRIRWALLGGLAWGYGILVRPLPGGPFLAMAGLFFLFSAPWSEWRTQWSRKLELLAVAAVPVLLLGGLFLWVNEQQSGDVLRSGYHVLDRNLVGQVSNTEGRMASSVGAALLRQNFWLFGWPLSLLFIPFCRRCPGLVLFVALIVAEYGYRLFVPKTVVATTGPIYVTEIVPLLALMSASGMIGLKRRLCGFGLPGKRWVVGFSAASFLVAASTFMVVQFKNIHRSCELWNTSYRLLAEKGANKALVFANFMVPPLTSWSYFPPNPKPTLDEDVIFVRPIGPKEPAFGEPPPPDYQQKKIESFARAIRFWQTRFGDRSGWSFLWKGDKPILIRLSKDSRPALGPLPASLRRKRHRSDPTNNVRRERPR